MKIAIVGSRSFNNYEMLKKEILSRFTSASITEIISGGAKGADTLAEQFAKEFNIKLTIFKPDWSLGRGAGMIRNKKIIESSNTVFAFWDGKSKGTLNSIGHSQRMIKLLYIITYDENDLLTIDPKKYIGNYFKNEDL